MRSVKLGLFNTFVKYAPNRVFFSILIGVISGILYALLIPMIMAWLSDYDSSLVTSESSVEMLLGYQVKNPTFALWFLATVVLILVFKSISEIVLVRIASDLSHKLRESFYTRIISAPLESLENLGFSKIIAAINLDIPRIAVGAAMYPTIIISLVTLMGILFFLLYLNVGIFKIVLMSVVVGIIFFQIPMMLAKSFFTRARELQDEIQVATKSLVMGIQELKLNQEKQKEFLKQCLKLPEQEFVVNEKKANTVVTFFNNFGDLLSFLVIAVICFVYANYISISNAELSAVVMALLYIVGPIVVLLDSIPRLAMSTVSFRKVNQLKQLIDDERFNLDVVPFTEWQGIEFKKVFYTYRTSDEENGFVVGPISFSAMKGQITFIIGGNGSGKSTLSKLITMLYLPDAGDIYFGETRLTANNFNSFRQMVTAVFTNFYLFDELKLQKSLNDIEIVNSYLKELHLDKKVTVVDGKFSTTSLSDGQRKRLALLVTFLEDKPVYLFDEWAADQDPTFKKVFYNNILPSLKSKNKVVLVISHDEVYFDVADQIIVMDNGKIKSINKAA